MLTPPTLEHVCDLLVELDPVRELGRGRAGARRIIPIVGGTVTGPRISGRILNLGADWQTIFHDGVAELDARYAFETGDGALIEVANHGYRHGPPEVIERLRRGEDCDPAEYYMRTTARLETGDPRYDWVNRMVFVGTGARHASAVEIGLYRVL
ncbi:MAG: DUF3237 domain-containing protein [Thalassobaculum sp.]|uniref:DUF3237 domain-containing protein n=1 Tax=Thalassobaculum sp. TaxID=2022740 RepID=UPI0032EAF4CC